MARQASVKRQGPNRDVGGSNAMDVAVIGVGMHPFGRFPGVSLKDLARVAVIKALDEPHLGVKDVDAVYSANAGGVPPRPGADPGPGRPP